MAGQVIPKFYLFNVHLQGFMFRLAATATKGDAAIQMVNVISMAIG
jgi:hypothetical protein